MPVTGLGSYSRVAQALNEQYALEPPIDRRQVESWYKRGTANAAGQPPPRPVADLPGTLPRQPRLMFDLRQWIEWMAPGTRVPKSNQHAPAYETPAERNARHRRAGY